MKYVLYVALCSLFLPFPLFSQSWLYPETIVEYNPLFIEGRENATVFLQDVRFWGEGGGYVWKRDNNHRWAVSVGGTMELVGSSVWNLIFETNMHLIVDPNNNITFNPRGFTWEEGLLLGMLHNDHSFQLGYQHRCKHDVDNLELLRVIGVEMDRTLIYGSLVARWNARGISLQPIDIQSLMEVHYYLLRQDQRFPEQSRSAQPSLEEIQFALRGCVRASLFLSSHTKLGCVVDARLTQIGELTDPSRSGKAGLFVEPAFEAYLDVIGKAGTMRFFGRYVYQPDDYVDIYPRQADLVLVGVRVFQGN